MSNCARRAIASASDVTFASSTVTVTKPTGTVDNDGMLALVQAIVIGAGPAPTITGPAGWTQKGSDETLSAGGLTYRFTWWEKKAASEGANYQWTLSSAAAWGGAMFTYDNIRTSGSFLDVKSTMATSTGTAVAANSITPTQTHQTIFFYAQSGASVTFTPPTGFGEWADTGGVTAADMVSVAPRATGTITATGSTSDTWVAWAISLFSEDSATANYTEVNTTANGQPVVILVPTATINTKALVIDHGYTRLAATTLFYPDDTAFANLEAYLALGYTVAASDQHGDNWGNQNAVDDDVALIALLASTYGINGVCLLGASMGGIPALIACATSAHALIRGFIGISPACDLDWFYDNGYSASIDTAYASNYAVNAVGHDPVLRAGADYAFRRYYLVASTDDVVAPKANHTDVFASLVANTTREITVVSTTGPHAAPVYSNTDIIAFLGRCFARLALPALGVG